MRLKTILERIDFTFRNWIKISKKRSLKVSINQGFYQPHHRIDFLNREKPPWSRSQEVDSVTLLKELPEKSFTEEKNKESKIGN